jgi:hypothetical protein
MDVEAAVKMIDSSVLFMSNFLASANLADMMDEACRAGVLTEFLNFT